MNKAWCFLTNLYGKLWKVLLGVGCCIILFSCSGFTQGNFMERVNLVRNSSFEIDQDGDNLPDNWILPLGMCTWDNQIVRSGKYSLRFENKNPEIYRLIIQHIPLEPGVCYEASVWIKAEGVTGGIGVYKGAGLCIEWSDEKGKWLGGHYPECFEGTFDWRLLRSRPFKVPKEAKTCSVVLYIRRGGTGKVWFDDVEVIKSEHVPLFQVFLLKPSYRGIIEAKKPFKAEAEIRIHTKQWPLELEGLSVKVEIGDKKIKELDVIEEVFRFSFSIPPLPEGKHLINFSLISNTDKILWKERIEIESLRKEKIKEFFKNAVYIDNQQRLIVNGKPFFPIGIYLGGAKDTEEEHLKRLSEAGFNTILCYGYGPGTRPGPEEPIAYMDRAQKFGLKVIYSVKDFYEGTKYFPRRGKSGLELAREYVTLLKDHPALLAWYINDELRIDYIPQIKEMYKLVKSIDPNHPTYQALCVPDEFGFYFDCLDAIGPDPYPVPRRPLEMVSEWVDTAAKEMRKVKPVWAILQAFAHRVYSGDEKDRDPTFEEKRCMTYLALTHGVKGIIYYSYFDLFSIDRGKGLKASTELFEERFDHVKKLAGELNRLAPILLEGKEISLKGTLPSHVHLKAIKYGDNLYILVTNAGNEPASIELSLPFIPSKKIKDLEEKIRGLLVNKRTFQDTLQPLECVTYVVE